jgi:hypothetical protein
MGIATTTSGVNMTGSSTQRIPPQADSDYYVGFEAEGQHIGLLPSGGSQGMTSPVAYWHVPDIEAKLAEVTAAISHPFAVLVDGHIR